MSYTIATYSPALDEQIAALQTHLWSPDPGLNAAYLRWKYRDNPYLPDVSMRVAVHEGRAVAMRGLCGALWELDDGAAPHLLPYADDFVVAPEHRNKGIARAVLESSLEDGMARGYPYAVNPCTGPVTTVVSLANGWRRAGQHDRMIRAPRSVPSWTWRFDKVRRKLGMPLTPLRRFDRWLGRPRDAIEVSREPRPEEMAALVATLPWDGRIRHVRDARYFRWRFQNPLHDYRFLYWDDGGLQGYVVVSHDRFARGPYPWITISDLEGTTAAVRASLLDAAIVRCGVANLHTWVRDDSSRALLARRGFRNAESGASGVSVPYSGLLVRQLGRCPGNEPWLLGRRNVLDYANWDLRMLYWMGG